MASGFDFNTWKWTNEKLIARGTYADVQQVVTDKNFRCVAKTIRLPLQLGEGEQEILEKLDRTFYTEKRLCVLDHKNVVKFYDMAILNKESAVVVFMELFEGHTLEKFVDGKPQAEDTVQLLASQICSALNYLHNLESPVLHRDINSRTVMVSDDKKVKLIDFGLAIQLVDSASLHISTDPKGDPCFMAPELFLSEETEKTPYTSATDVWAFGCTVYHMATGHRPHIDCKNMLAIVRRVHNDGAPQLPDTCSEVLINFYGHCTNRSKTERKTAAQLTKHEFLLARRALEVQPEAEAQKPEQDASVTGEAKAPEAVPVIEENEYPTNSPRKGLCLVFSIAKYIDSTRFPWRPEQQIETREIQKTFERLQFTVEVHIDLTAENMWSVLHSTASSADLSNYGSFVCIIMAHGASSRIYTSDGDDIEMRDIVARFRANQSPGLKGKPKLVFLHTKTSDSERSPSFGEASFHLRESDFLLCGATVEKSDVFVKTLCRVIGDVQFGRDHIENIVNEVNQRLGLPNLKRAPEIFYETSSVSSLTKKFFLSQTTDGVPFPEKPEKWTDKQLTQARNTQTDANQVYGPMEQTLLTIAAIRDTDDLVSQLLKTSPPTSVIAKDVMGRTAFCWAAHMGHRNVLDELEKALKHDPDALATEVNRGDNLQQTPIILAAKEHRTHVIDQLTKMKAHLNAQDSLKYTALSYAAKSGFEDTVLELLRLGADPKIVEFSGNSPLIWAARFGHTGVIRILGDYVTDVAYWRMIGERNMNAQEWAKYCERFECARAIQDIIQRLVQEISPGTVRADPNGGSDDPNDPGGGQTPGGGSNASNLRGSDGPSGLSGEPGGQGDRATNSPYPMASDAHSVGLALIINIVDFPPGSELSRRAGSMADMREGRLYQSFSRLGFECRQFVNVNGRFFDNFLTTVCTEEELQNCQAFLVCLMSHGEQDYIFAHDGAKINLEERIFSQVRQRQELNGKPKIFITQACRDIPDDRFTTRRLGQGNAGMHEDCLYFYSVIRGDVSLRDPEHGGFFTQELSDVILNEYDQRNEDFSTVMQAVIARVGRRSQWKQVPCSNSTIRKPLRFPVVGLAIQNH